MLPSHLQMMLNAFSELHYGILKYFFPAKGHNGLPKLLLNPQTLYTAWFCQRIFEALPKLGLRRQPWNLSLQIAKASKLSRFGYRGWGRMVRCGTSTKELLLIAAGDGYKVPFWKELAQHPPFRPLVSIRRNPARSAHETGNYNSELQW